MFSSVFSCFDLSKSLLFLDEAKLDLYLTLYKSYYFLIIIFSACCLLFLIHVFFELLEYILFYKINLEKENIKLIQENQQFVVQKLHQMELNKKYQKKIKKLQKELLKSYD